MVYTLVNSMSSARPIRLRFAPSPTGYLHVGGARTALFNWLFAKKYGGQFLLRIEDTDKARSTEASTTAIYEGLEWLGLQWDEDVVYQGANLDRHQAHVAQLLKAGTAYRCFCTAAELEAQRKEAHALKEAFRYDRRCDSIDPATVEKRVAAGEPFVVRFRMPEGTTTWDDLVHGTITFPNKDIGEGDFIVLRTDGTPIYNMAVVSDDIAMEISLVMRGDDHISNTPKQILLYEALGAPLPIFAHLPMIHGMDGKKLSKRHGATAVGEYQHLGILPQAMLNFLALLGWSPGNDIEVMTLEQMIELFDASHLSKKAAIFDTQKLEWMNGQHLSLIGADVLLPRVAPLLADAGLTTLQDVEHRKAWFLSLLELLKVRARTLDDVVRQASPYLRDDIEYDPDAVAKQWKDRSLSADALRGTRETLAQLERWEPEPMEEALRALAERMGTTGGKIFQPMRVALTGLTVSPGIFDVLVMLGRERSLARIDRALEWLAAN
ncbi:MAG: glutamyl-tRNA synthetase [Gemmatimonadetes bacterium]|nr:glutamyl-tRNA synthetase [Gemmatimonadota bacterium]